MYIDPALDFDHMIGELSDVQRKIYNFVAGYIQDRHIAPSDREIANALKIPGVSLIKYHLDQIQDIGLISREPRIPRSIKLMKPRGVPVKGHIRAGMPLKIFDSPERRIELGPGFEDESIYALVVQGDSMIEDHICNGDIIIVEEHGCYRDGDIVVAVDLRDGEASATLKGFYYEKDGIRLQPSNENLEAFFIPKEEWDENVEIQGSENWRIQGKVIQVLRSKPRARYRSSAKQSEPRQ
jgi:repressor LexA